MYLAKFDGGSTSEALFLGDHRGIVLRYLAYLDRRVVGSFMTMTSVMSPYVVKYSLRLSGITK